MARTLRGVMGKIPPNITCGEVEKFIFDYVEGTLPLLKKIRVNLHLLLCRDCRSYIAAYRRSIELGKAFFDNPDSALPEDMPEELISIIMKNMNKD